MPESTTNTTRIERMRECAEAALKPVHLTITDDSHKHVGHVGARDGRGHFTMLVVADVFSGVNSIGRHRLVYDAMGEMMVTDIHALSIRAYSPDEWNQNP